MSNCQFFDLPLLQVEHHQAREVLRCILHTILFNRTLGYVCPRDVTSEIFDVTYIHCGDALVNDIIESKLSQYQEKFERSSGEQLQVCLAFYEKRERSGLIFGRQEERLVWEQWVVHLDLQQPQDRSFKGIQIYDKQEAQKKQQALQQSLVLVLQKVIELLNKNREHIPPITTTAPMSFHFDISVLQDASSPFGLEMVKRVLLSTHPPAVLQ